VMIESPNQQTVWIRQWGGVVQRGVPEHVAPGMFLDALNFEISSQGELSPRLGFELLASTGTPDGKAIRTIYPADMDGTLRLLAATSDNVYEYKIATETWALVQAITNKTARPMLFATLNAATNPIVVFGNGADVLRKWDGTTVLACGGSAPTGRPIAYKNYLAVFDIPNKPGKVLFSYYNGNPDIWDVDGIERFLEMRGKVTGVFAFTGLVVFTQTRAELFLGDPDQAQGMQPLSETVGCVNHATIADCGGTLVWLSQAGVAAWDGAGRFPAMLLSSPDAGDAASSSIRRDIDRIAWDTAGESCAVYHPARQRYLLGVQLRASAAGETFWRTMTFDFLRKAWHPWDLESGALATMVQTSTGRQIVVNGTSEGALRIQSDSAVVDEGLTADTEYEYWAQSPFWDGGEPNADKWWRRLTVGSTGLLGDAPAIAGGLRTVKFEISGEFGRLDLDNISVRTTQGGFILGVSVLGDRLSSGNWYLESPAPMALRAKHMAWKVFGQGVANAVTLAALGWTFRMGVKRPHLIAPAFAG